MVVSLYQINLKNTMLITLTTTGGSSIAIDDSNIVYVKANGVANSDITYYDFGNMLLYATVTSTPAAIAAASGAVFSVTAYQIGTSGTTYTLYINANRVSSLILDNTTFRTLQYNERGAFVKNIYVSDTLANLVTAINVTNAEAVTLAGTQTISGAKTFSAVSNFTNVTDATTKDTGSIITEGGIGVEKAVFAGTSVTATTFLKAGTIVSNAAGSAAAPAYTFTGQVDMGLYKASATEMGIAASGAFVGRVSLAKGIEANYINGTNFVKVITAPVNSNTDPAPVSAVGMLNGILTATPGGAIAYTLPTGTQMEAAAPWISANEGFEFTLINIGAGGAITVTAAADFTIVGDAVVAAATSAKFIAVKTAAHVFVLYRA